MLKFVSAAFKNFLSVNLIGYSIKIFRPALGVRFNVLTEAERPFLCDRGLPILPVAYFYIVVKFKIFALEIPVFVFNGFFRLRFFRLFGFGRVVLFLVFHNSP